MLKRILILLLCLSFKLFLNAQGSFEPSTHIGIHGGVNLSTVSLKPEIKQEFITSREFGIVFRQDFRAAYRFTGRGKRCRQRLEGDH